MLIGSCLALCFLCQVEGRDVHKCYAEWPIAAPAVGVCWVLIELRGTGVVWGV